jgi:excisionase family DNA binding protein
VTNETHPRTAWVGQPWRVGEAAEFLRISSNFLYRKIATGEVQATKLGRVVLVPSAEVERLAKGVS